jgi:threonine synthase
VQYVSTRGRAPELGFADVLLAGLADDGGLYVPATWPSLPLPMPGRPYAEVAALVMAPFVGAELGEGVLERLCREAYATFRHPAVCPLVQVDTNQFVLELFHGPTLAFKDVALQLVGRLFDHVLGIRGERVTIVGATSGDTGSAAIDGVQGCDNVDIVILYPAGRVSEVQRRQMTTVDAPNVHTVAVDGSFDDCQDLVKAMFADELFRARHRLSAVNSINWARVMAQVVYYVTAATSLGGGPGGRAVNFCVPTGNFGNVLAGWVAERMGLPVERLIVASNRNDILTRFLHSGIMATSQVVPSLSPSMDIQVSSNFERLLFELNHRDGAMTAEQLQRFRAAGTLTVEPEQFDVLGRQFVAARLDDEQTIEVMARTYRDTAMAVDPHTAVGLGAVTRLEAEGVLDPVVPVVTLATAHPAKFPDAVERATGVRPPLPEHLADLFSRPERTVTLAPELTEIERFVASVSRA